MLGSKSENNGTEELGLVTPTPVVFMVASLAVRQSYCGDSKAILGDIGIIGWFLTHCALVTLYGNKDLGQHWFG